MIDQFNLKERITKSKELIEWFLGKQLVIYMKVENSIYKCKIEGFKYTILDTKIICRRIVYGSVYELSLSDYNVTWSDSFSNINNLHQLSLFDVGLKEKES